MARQYFGFVTSQCFHFCSFEDGTREASSVTYLKNFDPGGPARAVRIIYLRQEQTQNLFNCQSPTLTSFPGRISRSRLAGWRSPGYILSARICVLQ
jgi:hypothetical protein